MTDQSKDRNGQHHLNRWSATYERSYMQWLLFDRVHRGVLARVPPAFVPADILDIGCGTGRLLRRMGGRWPGAHLIGADVSEGMVNRALAQTPGARIEQAPAEHLPLPDNSVDLVTSTSSFHHWSDHAQGVREAARVLRRCGLFVLADMALPFGARPLSAGHVRAMFESAGLVVRSQTHPVPCFAFTVGEKA